MNNSNEKTASELEAANARIKELEKQVSSLQSQLSATRQTLEQYQHYSRRSYRDDYDYLPYEEGIDR